MLLLTRDQQPEADDRTPETKTKRPGATLMEYVMMLSLIITVCLVAIGYLGTSNNASMNTSSNAIEKSINQTGKGKGNSNGNGNGNSKGSGNGNSKGTGKGN